MLETTGMFSRREIDVCLDLADECLRDPKQKEYVFDVAEEDGSATGFVISGDALLADRVWEVYWIVVDPAWQGRGLGRRLLERAEEGMRGAGARMSLIETSGRPAYAGTHRFYMQCGYREAARIRDFYREGDDLVTYRKDFEVSKSPR